MAEPCIPVPNQQLKTPYWRLFVVCEGFVPFTHNWRVPIRITESKRHNASTVWKAGYADFAYPLSCDGTFA